MSSDSNLLPLSISVFFSFTDDFFDVMTSRVDPGSISEMIRSMCGSCEALW